MSDYHKLLPKGGSDEEEDHDVLPQTKPRSAWSSFARDEMPKVRLALEIYIAVIVTLICLLQILRFGDGASDPEPLKTSGRHMYDWTFWDNSSYMGLEHEYDHFWDWPSTTGLAMPSPENPNVQVAVGISMFHQLHCLGMLRMGLQSAKLGEELVWDEHMPHCLDYIRKSILCYGDDTIELPTLIDGQRVGFIDGDGALHKCQTSKTLFDLRGWPMPSGVQ